MNNRNIVIIVLLVILIILIFYNFQEKYSNHDEKIFNIDKLLDVQKTTVTGNRGSSGRDGSQGPQGIKGAKGDKGARGPRGPKGDKGDSLKFKTIFEKDTKIGIGTKKPLHKFHVEGNTMVNGNIESTGSIKSSKMETGDITTKNISTQGTITSTDKITTKELESREVLKGQKICIDDVCLNKETLKKLVEGKHKSHFRKGMIVAWQGTSPPPGWKLCDGQNGTPDLRGRFILGSGQGTGLTPRNSGSKGGSEENKLEGGHIPVHRHYLTHDKWGVGGSGVATDTTKTRFHDGKLVSNNGKMFLSQTYAYHDVNSAVRNNPNFEYILHGAKSDKNQYEPTAGLTGKPVNQFGDKMGVGTKSVNNMPPYYVLAYIMKMEDEVQDSEIKTKTQYQTEIQDLQAKIQNSEAKILQLENRFKQDVIMDKNLEVKGKIKLGDFNFSTKKNTPTCNNCLYIKKDGVTSGFQIGQYDKTEKVGAPYGINSNGLFLSPTVHNNGGLGTPKQKFDDIAIDGWSKWNY